MAASATSRFGPGGEFRRIEAILAAAGDSAVPAGRGGAGDDAAVLGPAGAASLVVSSDLTIEGVHFRREWLSWEAVGWRAVAAALSDLAAMGAKPLGVLLSLALDPGRDAGAGPCIARGAGSCLRRAGAPLVGGDLSASPGPAILGVTVLGTAEHPLLRSGARPGDAVWVTGRLGGAAAAIEAWTAGRDPDPAAREAFERPVPRLREIAWLASRVEIHAAIDLSDGIAGDAGHVAAASGTRLRLDGAALPLHASAIAGREGTAARRLAATGGEDYELMLAVADGTLEAVAAAFIEEFGVELTRVGTVEEGSGVTWDDSAGRQTLDPTGGFDHFPE